METVNSGEVGQRVQVLQPLMLLEARSSWINWNCITNGFRWELPDIPIRTRTESLAWNNLSFLTLCAVLATADV